MRAETLEARIAADLALGQHASVIAELQRLVDEEPLREQLWAHLMLALYRSARQSDALAAYQQCRRRLDEEVGIEPHPSLRQLEAEILQQAPSLDWVPTRGPAAASLAYRDEAGSLQVFPLPPGTLGSRWAARPRLTCGSSGTSGSPGCTPCSSATASAGRSGTSRAMGPSSTASACQGAGSFRTTTNCASGPRWSTFRLHREAAAEPTYLGTNAP